MASPSRPGTSGAASRARRPIARIGASTIRNGLSFRVVLATPEGTRTIDCGEHEFIWDAAARAGIALPAICHQGRCLTCAATLVEGDVDQTASASYFPEDRAAGFVLLCTGCPRTDLELKTHQQWAMRRHRSAHGLPSPYG